MITQPVPSPRASAPALAPAPVGPDAGARASAVVQRALILAVDDEPDALDFLRLFLGGEGFDFVQASSGAQAFLLIEAQRPDLLIVDVMMAGMTGFELCDLLRSSVATRDLPIIIYSAHETKTYSNSGLYDLAFLKPVDPEELLWAIRALLPESR
ncbi:MAG: response regulator [Gammaproteobacteria bacterium]